MRTDISPAESMPICCEQLLSYHQQMPTSWTGPDLVEKVKQSMADGKEVDFTARRFRGRAR